jgi:hypothetical protein
MHHMLMHIQANQTVVQELQTIVHRSKNQQYPHHVEATPHNIKSMSMCNDIITPVDNNSSSSSCL